MKSKRQRSWWKPLIKKNIIPDEINNPIKSQLRNFIGVVNGSEKAICSGNDGLKSLSVIEAIKLSAKTGKVEETVPVIEK